MAWRIEFTPAAAKQLKKLDPEKGRRITRYLQENICSNPREQGKALKGALREFWRYRVGNFRVLVRIEDDKLVVLVIRVGHRRNIYR